MWNTAQKIFTLDIYRDCTDHSALDAFFSDFFPNMDNICINSNSFLSENQVQTIDYLECILEGYGLIMVCVHLKFVSYDWHA